MSCLKKTLAVLLFSWVVLLPAAQAAEPQPVEVFSRLPQFYGVSMSPDGQRFAMERNSADGDLAVLMTLDLSTGDAFYLLKADNKKVKINWYRWANNEDLLVSARYEVSRAGKKFFRTRLYLMKYNQQGGDPEMVID